MRQLVLIFLLTGFAQACSPDRVEPVLEHRWVRLGDGDSLHFAVTGSGADTIVVLSGGPSWPSRYLRQPLAGLAKEHGIVFLDLRGRGRSSPMQDSLSAGLDRDLADLAAVQSELRLGRVVLAGHGYGAGLAAMYALRSGDRVARLILLSPMFSHVNLVWQASFQPNDSVAVGRFIAAKTLGRDTVDAAGFCHDFWGFELSPVEETDSLVLDQLAGAMCDADAANLRGMAVLSRSIRRSLGSWDWRDSLTRIQVPALVVQGGGNLFLQRTGEIWSQLLPHASFVTLARHPHFPWLGEERQFQDSVQAFLARSPADASRDPRLTRDKTVTAIQPD